MKPFILGVIFARGGSKGVHRKNIKLLAGKPLIAYAIECGLGVKAIDQLIVSTDDAEIADVAKQYGADVPFVRPQELAEDDTPMLLAQQHAVTEYENVTGQKVDILVSIPTTSPLRESKDVEGCLNKFLEEDVDSVMSVTDSHRNPYFNMVELDKNGYAQLVKKPVSDISRRQEAPKVYDLTTVCYVIKASYLRQGKPLIEGRVRVHKVPQERALDIDTSFDFELAEYLLSKKTEVL